MNEPDPALEICTTAILPLLQGIPEQQTTTHIRHAPTNLSRRWRSRPSRSRDACYPRPANNTEFLASSKVGFDRPTARETCMSSATIRHPQTRHIGPWGWPRTQGSHLHCQPTAARGRNMSRASSHHQPAPSNLRGTPFTGGCTETSRPRYTATTSRLATIAQRIA